MNDTPTLVLFLVAILATFPALGEGRWYNARESLRSAEVGTSSPPKPQSRATSGRSSNGFERMRCHRDWADRLRHGVICESRNRNERQVYP